MILTKLVKPFFHLHIKNKPAFQVEDRTMEAAYISKRVFIEKRLYSYAYYV